MDNGTSYLIYEAICFTFLFHYVLPLRLVLVLARVLECSKT